MPNSGCELKERPLANTLEDSIRVEGLQVSFRRAGTGPALVLMHGLLGYSFSWRHVIPILARSRQLFAPDMPGSGFSECDPRLDCRLSSAAKRLLGFLDATGIASCDLVGSSYGGATAMMLAALAPSRVRRLVLVSPANPWSLYGRRRLALLRNPLVGALFPKLARPLRPLHNYFLRRLYGDPSRITREAFRGYSEPLRRGGRFEHAIGVVRTWHADMQELKAALPRVSSVPTLLVWGIKDRAVDPASAQPLSQNFQTARISIMEGAGHLPYEEYPEEFSRIVIQFLTYSPEQRWHENEASARITDEREVT